MKFKDITTWSVFKGVATPVSINEITLNGSGHRVIPGKKERETFEQFSQQHTYATNAPDGSYSADRFGEIVWQYYAQLKLKTTGKDSYKKWVNVGPIVYKYYKTFENYSTSANVETRQFLPFIDQVKAESPKFGEWISVEMVQQVLDWLHSNISARVVYTDHYDYSRGVEGAEVDYFPETAGELFAEMGIVQPVVTGPTYTQEQMLAFGEAVKKICAEKAKVDNYGWDQFRVDEQSILDIDINDLIK